MKKNNQAFAPVIVILAVVVVLALGGSAYYLGKTSKNVSGTVTESSISVISPNGGEVWTKGDKVKISWTGKEDIKFVNIRLNILGNPDSQNFSAAIASRVLNSGSYDWTVQNLYAEVLGVTDLPESNKYSIVVEDSDDSAVYDSSDGTFSIKAGTTATIEKTYRNDALGFEFKYPSKLSLTASGDIVNLLHSIPFENRDGGCDMKGDSELSKTLSDFDLSIKIVSGAANPSYVDGNYSAGVLNGKWSYMGAEGCGQTNYYFPISGNRTLVVTKNEVQMLSNNVTPDVKAKVLAVPGVISYDESKVMLDQILSSFKFISPDVESFNNQPARIVSISQDGRVLALDILTQNPRWISGGSEPYYINQNNRIRNLTLGGEAMFYDGCSKKTSSASDFLVQNINNVANFDIQGGLITSVYRWCTP